MSRTVDLLREAQVFHIATIDGSVPRVRPFGFVMDFDDKIYFTTGNKKDFFKQIKKNPAVELSAMLPDGRWIRVQGRAIVGGSLAAKKRAFEIFEGFKDLYQSPDNPTFEVFYLESPSATLYSFTEAPEKIL
ncbi:MAG: pyridoxamine 5'-phosphate oxidase family protein [Synergistaceae bacterium]|jgi:uncharacterized pyridoxamine 5'-phosphate oxidase family protein|nr:pyridoxamine 5'-phosphate oxidase family protein [Synergistaceae bacterium]